MKRAHGSLQMDSSQLCTVQLVICQTLGPRPVGGGSGGAAYIKGRGEDGGGRNTGESQWLGVTTCKGSVSLQKAKRSVPRMLQMPLESVLTTGRHL